MAHTTIPAALNVRLHEDERAAIAAVQAAISAPHRRPVTVSDAVRAALLMAADAVRARGHSGAAQ